MNPCFLQQNFLALCASDYYKGCIFHRNIKGFIVQTGDPTGTGKNGQSIWKQKFKDEFNENLKTFINPQHTARGVVSMANNGPDSNGSQFFITYSKQTMLDMKYSIFGKVIDGWDVLDELERAPVEDKTYRPLTDIHIQDDTREGMPSPLLGLFGQVVIGPPGRKVAVVNLDPANETLPYTCAVDLKDLIRLDEVMQSLYLGPNGGLLYCMEYLYKNRDWLTDRLTKLKRDSPKTYVLFDCPGQVELYCVNGAFRQLLSFLTLTHLPTSKTPESKQQVGHLPKHVIETPIQSHLPGLGLRLSSVHLVDSHYCTCPGKFISVLLTSLVSMLQLGLPHVNVLSKIDLIEQYAPLKFNLDFFTEVLDLSYLVEQLDDVPFFAKYKKLNRRLAELVQDTALVHFLILDVQDRTHLEQIMRHADKGNGYVFGTDEQRTLQSMLSCASGAEFSNDLICLAQEKYTHQNSTEKQNI
ncbi:unnamed protein product [Schistocephalus solidus]|uniref:GPN-loop GTPase 2 n=1 Tax=Schistocephalus solidus TaxID=70667 RepID=A0A183T295_SCHSO|nr:unnamed protein product [Schistocephalus solidus]